MRLASCRYRGDVFPAYEQDGAVALLEPSSGHVIPLMSRGAVGPAVATVSLEDVEFLPPIKNPGKIICVGLNYHDHVQESAADPQPYPSLFPRFADSFVGHRQRVVAPAVSNQLDYEGELAVVIGRKTWRVQAGDAMAYVGGYTCLAENSVRDFQFHSRQVTPGRNFLASGSFGPWLTTADEVGNPAKLELTTRLNGKVVQQASLADLIFDIPSIISYISQFTPLFPGDIIATGTPSGVGGARKPPLWLKPGDVLEVVIPGVGHLENSVVAEPDDHVSNDEEADVRE